MVILFHLRQRFAYLSAMKILTETSCIAQAGGRWRWSGWRPWGTTNGQLVGEIVDLSMQDLKTGLTCFFLFIFYFSLTFSTFFSYFSFFFRIALATSEESQVYSLVFTPELGLQSKIGRTASVADDRPAPKAKYLRADDFVCVGLRQKIIACQLQ
ncbi:uncharacterized protein BP01DRAFT_160600 [Aspergillus saccharolyticus JOP 1030-1]|uniref:Uncharacterized protein n=1 Tax=Aspergillus saccharolyticus JOP 1030-1 TaxID=1450539 RepID=A0A318Z5T9_9EURO|nr:hypothetical protein BP01DRAFT_160600 [Aspergillus saccharolyticus JOP 1030-1]PYH41717.1 hypothetical protein BP01DRAFT_160600 [Aspergillus saccharolyticus JOP 1030-1]